MYDIFDFNISSYCIIPLGNILVSYLLGLVAHPNVGQGGVSWSLLDTRLVAALVVGLWLLSLGGTIVEDAH